MKLPSFKRENDAVADTYASTVAPSDRMPPPTRGWRPPRDVVIGACVCVLMGMLTFAFVQPIRQNRIRSRCESNLKQITLATLQYVRDYDERYPLVFADGDSSSRFDSAQDIGWAQALYPYIKNQFVYQCPAEPNPADWRDGQKRGYSDYFYNARLASVGRESIEPASNVITYGDNIAGTAANSITAFKKVDPAVAVRHAGGANYSFVDAHVKWLKPSQVSDAVATTGRYSLRFGQARHLKAP